MEPENAPVIIPPTAANRVVQIGISALTHWLFPIALILVTAGINKLASYSPLLITGLDPQLIAYTVVGLVIAAVASLVTFILKHTSAKVVQIQQILNAKGIPIEVDKYFGQQTLDGVIKAINDPTLKVGPIDIAAAKEALK